MSAAHILQDRRRDNRLQETRLGEAANSALKQHEFSRAFRVFKRASDIILGSVLMVILLPVFAVASLWIKLTDRGPIFFTQTRLGRGGESFKMYKFRTMSLDADSKKDSLQALNEQSGPVFKIKNDPRITKSGRVLRKYSIDELPQLLNVIKGDMAMVGPRPPVPKEVAQYKPWQLRRLAVKPGLTCTWQVSGRNHIDFDEWVRMDIRYIEHASPLADIKLIVRTIPAVLVGEGAY